MTLFTVFIEVKSFGQLDPVWDFILSLFAWALTAWVIGAAACAGYGFVRWALNQIMFIWRESGRLLREDELKGRTE